MVVCRAAPAAGSCAQAVRGRAGWHGHPGSQRQVAQPAPQQACVCAPCTPPAPPRTWVTMPLKDTSEPMQSAEISRSLLRGALLRGRTSTS